MDMEKLSPGNTRRTRTAAPGEPLAAWERATATTTPNAPALSSAAKTTALGRPSRTAAHTHRARGRRLHSLKSAILYHRNFFLPSLTPPSVHFWVLGLQPGRRDAGH